MALHLLGQQVALRNLKLLLVGVAGQLDDLHPVQQGPGDGVGGVGGGDEQHVGQVEGHLQEVVPEGAVLLHVQHLQQGGRRVAPVVPPQLVDLVQQDQGVAAPRLIDGGDDPAGHRAHIGLPVAPDLRLVADAAQGNAGELPVHGPGHRHGHRGLAHAGRTHKADYLPLQIRGQLLHSQELQNALLHLVQAEVVVVQGLPGPLHAHPLLGLPAPGELQAHIQVVALHRGLRGAEGLFGQTAQLLLQLLPHLVGQLGLGDLLAVVLDLRVAALALAQLGLDGLHLLPQVVIPLVVRHLLPGPVLDLHIQPQDLHLPGEQAVQPLQAAHRTQLLQDGLLVAVAHGDILGDKVGDIPRVLAGQHVDEQVGGRLGGQLGVLAEHLIGGADQGLGLGGALPRLLLLDGLHLRLQVRGGAQQALQAAPVHTLHHHPYVVAGGAQDLPHRGDGANTVKVFCFRVFHRDVLLPHQKHRAAGGHGLFQGLDGDLPGHVEVDQHIGEYRQSPQGDHRHCGGFFHRPFFLHSSHFLSGILSQGPAGN